MPETPNFRDHSGLATFLKFCLIVYLAVAVVGLWSGWQQIELIQRAASGVGVSDEEAKTNDVRQAAIGGLQLLVYIVTGIIFLRWTYLSNRNARSFGATGMEYTPGWAAGWYFIPVAAIWKPYQALKETFKASHPDFTEDWQQAPHPGILPVWWTLWILGNIVGQIAFRLSRRAEAIPELLASSWATIVSDLLDLLLSVLAIAVVAKLTAWQLEKESRLLAAITIEPGDAS